MIVIGLTGGFGSGKSTVSAMLQELGAQVLDADKLAHELYRPGTPAWKEIVTAFGPDVLKENGEIDRKWLGERVFRDRQALEKLNAIIHPRLYPRVKEILEGWRREGVKVAILEAALLLEAGWTPLVNRVWVTRADTEKIVERLKKNKGLSQEEIRARLSSQMDVEEKARKAHAIIDTSGTLDQVRMQVEELWQGLTST